MLGADDNNFKLLKMKERVLELSNGNSVKSLEEYGELARSVDSAIFNEIKSKLMAPNYQNHSLEEELSFLENIKSQIDQLVELQLKLKNVYSKYADGELVLSDLSVLKIDEINERLSIISGYLINVSNISSNKEKLESLTEHLSFEEKKRDSLVERLFYFEKELREYFYKAEGRIFSKISNDTEFASIAYEYRQYGIDLNDSNCGNDFINEILNAALEERKEIEEKLRAIDICYENSPTLNNRQILDDARLEAFKIRYKVTLLKILILIITDERTYNDVKNKRELLKDLINYRTICLRQLGIKYLVDPFSRIKIDEQIKSLNGLSDNSRTIAKIRKEISDLTSRIEEMINVNSEYLTRINDSNCIISSKPKIKIDDPISLEDVIISPNEVVKIRKMPKSFKKAKVRDKTKGVIARVYQMINSSCELSKDDVVPELIIEEEPFDDIFSDTDDTTKKEQSSNDLFEVIEPFKDAPMFVDRSDDGYDAVMGDTKQVYQDDDVSLPELSFWTVPSDTKVSETDGTVDFDSQIDELLDNGKHKVKSLTA